MKQIKIIILSAIVAGVAMLMSCGGGDDPSPQQQMTNQLVNGGEAWRASGGTVTVDGSNVTSDWSGFTITFTEDTYTTSGSLASEVWPSSGTWDFANETTTSNLQRGDGTSMNVSIDNNELTITFDAPWGINGRTTSIGGGYIFILNGN
jgi:hypothetical protein